MTREPIRHYMTPNPHSVGRNQTLAAAHTIMRANAIRHLPVLEAGKLIGLVSQRDLHFIESLRDVDPAIVTVEEAMTAEPFTVSPDASLATVAREMAAKRYGSAVVVERGKVVGMFTTTDALRVLVDRLEEDGPGKGAPVPAPAKRKDSAGKSAPTSRARDRA